MTARKFTAYLLRSVSLFAFTAMLCAPAHANPEGGHVVAGDATIAGTAPNEVTIRQTSDKAIIDWNSFSIGADERTVFDQPSSASVTLNRDIGGNPSAIFGRLQSNGRIFLVNRNGILFGENARIDVAGLVASTADIANENFLAGRHEFDIPGAPGASVINLGELSIADHGLAALVAPHVRNDGAIVARLGKVVLASGDGFALDLHGDDMISLFVEDGADQQLFGLDGELIDSLVENNGWIGADGGFVILTAAGARQAVNNVVTHHGVIEARTIGRENGQIVLGGDVEGNVIVTGDIRATGGNEGETGGHITVTGERLALLQQATVDASGFAGGGTVLLGGDYMGGNGDPGVIETYNVAVERGPVPTAKRTVLAPDVTVAADALQEGNGGKVIVWADEATVSAARISARGGLLSGDGGFVETSGRYLDVREAADVSAPNGLAGTWLLDPIDIVVEDRPADLNIGSSTDELLFHIARSGREIWGDRFFPTGDPSFIDTDTIEAALDAGTNVLVTTRSSDGGGYDGNIHIRDDIVKSDGGFARLSFHAAGGIDVDRGVGFRSSSGRFNIELAAFGGRVTARGLGRVDLLGGALIVNSLTGIDIDSNYDMPNLFVGVNLRKPTPPGDVDVNIDFDNDRVRFSYTDELLTIPTGGIVLTDRQAKSFLEIETFHGTSLELEDRAILSIDRKWKISGLADAGAAHKDRLNDIPEVIGGANFYLRARDPKNNAVFPVIEVSDDEGLTVDRLIPTSPTGERLVATRSEIERVEREIREREQESEKIPQDNPDGGLIHGPVYSNELATYRKTKKRYYEEFDNVFSIIDKFNDEIYSVTIMPLLEALTESNNATYVKEKIREYLEELSMSLGLEMEQLELLNEGRNSNQHFQISYEDIIQETELDKLESVSETAMSTPIMIKRWSRSGDSEKQFHIYGLIGENVEKWIHTDGREYVFDTSTNPPTLINSGRNAGTFNYGHKPRSPKHVALDLLPWLYWGTGPDDVSTFEARYELFNKTGIMKTITFPFKGVKISN